ncbi:thiamine pyrophosphate-dependent enzyme [Taklimakanibacter deserti]|uniref:thiamine pyrophosphate-dependent enzyme n=1 Tax=Taklimakanibacter deserti TaxID=2267839 RepID=UPI000E64C03C
MSERAIRARARAIASAGGISPALSSGALAPRIDVSLSEGVVLGLLKQGVRKFFAVLGHGNTDIGEILRIYSEEGALRFLHCRNEIAMAHAATALAWIYGETPAVLCSIGPGALQAYAGSLAAASNGVGVYHLYGDETTHGEGYNMQQVVSARQGEFGRLTDILGRSFVLHTPEALRDALRRGTQTVHRPYFAGPFYLCLPINTQPKFIAELNLESLPDRLSVPRTAPADDAVFGKAADLILSSARIAIKAGGGARTAAESVRRLAERIGAAVILSPNSTGVLADAHPLNMHVGGSKGSISGNFAMAEAELLIVIGSRAVCQSDCSGTGYPKVRHVINLNGEIADATHYNRTTALTGDIDAVVARLLDTLGNAARSDATAHASAAWLKECAAQKSKWLALRAERTSAAAVFDAAWDAEILAQPAAVAAVARFAREVGALKVFDAGDVQATGFQVVEDDTPFETVTESGASYMGFAASSLLAAAAADKPRYMIAFSGDGSFIMNPQILIDAAVHKLSAMVVVFDNRRMGAISSLQSAQFGNDFGTNDDVAVDFVAMANAVAGVKGFHGGRTADELREALRAAYAHDGLSVVHVPVYWGEAVIGGMGSYGRWNVGPWVPDVEKLYADQVI